MHAYTITAKPNRRQLFLRSARRWTIRLSVAAALTALGLVVLVLRSARVIANLAATYAARLELYVSHRAGTPPLGQTAGVRLAEAFTAEFHRGYAQPPAA